MTDRELMQQALSVLCKNVYPRDGVRDNRHLTPKSHADIYQQTIDGLFNRLAQPDTPEVTPEVTPYVIDCPRCGHCCPQRTWAGLTREDMAELRQAGLHSISDYAFEVIANFLKEKNGG